MDENSGIHGMMLRYSVVAVCGDYVVKNVNRNKRQMNRQRMRINICTAM